MRIFYVVLLTIIFSSSVYAKKKVNYAKNNKTVELSAKKKKTRELKVIKRDKVKTVEKKAFVRENFIKKKEIEKLGIIEAQIANIKEILEDMDEDDPEQPKYMLNLAEKYRKKSKSLWLKGMSYDGPIANAKTKAEKRALEKKKESYLKKSTETNIITTDIYKNIYKNHPSYSHMDFVLFSWAHTLDEMKQTTASIRVHKKLVKDYPNSQFVAESFLAIGEYYFNNDDMETAKESYTRVLQYTDSEVYNYALYKRGWCDFNLHAQIKAFKVFVSILKTGDPNEKFIEQVKLDLVFVFSQFASPNKAISTFTKLFGDPGYLEYLEKLAYLYKDKQGKYEEAIQIFNELNDLESDEIKQMKYKIAILDASISLGKLRNLIRTALATGKYVDSIRKTYKDDDEFKKLNGTLEAIIKELATTYHKQAKETFNDKYFKIAWKFYQEYQKLFRDFPDYYPMVFQYALLLDEDLHRKEDAIDAYLNIITSKGKKDKTLVSDAVNNALAIYSELIKEESQKKKLVAGSCHKAKHPKPQKLTRRQNQFLKLVDIYIKHSPDAKDIPLVRYNSARIFYQMCHFDEAKPIFQDIVANFQKSKAYEPSAGMLLDILNNKKEYTKMHDLVTVLFKNKKQFSKAFREQLEENYASLAFMSPKELEDKGNFAKSAEGYYDFYKKYPKSTKAFIALYNSALMYENAGMTEETIRVRKEIVTTKKFHNKKERKDVLFFLAQNYQALAMFEEAATYYAEFFFTYNKDKKAKTAIEAAIDFNIAVGSRKSLRTANKFIDQYLAKKRMSKKEKAKWLFKKGENIDRLSAKQGRNYWNSFIDNEWRYLDDNEKIITFFKLGDDYKRLNNRSKTVATYKKGYTFYTKLSKKRRKRVKTAKEHLAGYKFYELEKRYKEFNAIRFKLPKSRMIKALKKKLKLKKGLVRDYFNAYTEFKDPNWSIAYFFKIASLLYDFARDIEHAPMPKFRNLKADGITKQEQKEMYQDDLYNAYIQPLEDEAFKAYLKCYNIAMKNKIFNQWVDKSMERMKKIDATRFKASFDELYEEFNKKEILFQKATFTDSLVRKKKKIKKKVVKEIKEEDVKEIKEEKKKKRRKKRRKNRNKGNK